MQKKNIIKAMHLMKIIEGGRTMNNNINAMEYKCEICGKYYSTIEERNKCEAKCLAERKKAEEALAKKKLEDEKKTRKEEIDTKYNELRKLINCYCKDYGSIQLGDYRYFDDNFPSLSKLLSMWF